MATITLQKIRPFAETQSHPIVGPVSGNKYVVDALGRVTVLTSDANAMMALGWLPAVPGSGGGTTPSSGVTTVDFGSFPGSDFATVTLTAADAADPNAILIAQVVPIATADHSADEHLVDPPRVGAINNGDGTITINAVPRDAIPSPIPPDPMPYGKWSVAWGFLQ